MNNRVRTFGIRRKILGARQRIPRLNLLMTLSATVRQYAPKLLVITALVILGIHYSEWNAAVTAAITGLPPAAQILVSLLMIVPFAIAVRDTIADWREED